MRSFAFAILSIVAITARAADRDAVFVDKARTEGSVTLYTSMQVVDSRPLSEAFEKKYETGMATPPVSAGHWRRLGRTGRRGYTRRPVLFPGRPHRSSRTSTHSSRRPGDPAVVCSEPPAVEPEIEAVMRENQREGHPFTCLLENSLSGESGTGAQPLESESPRMRAQRAESAVEIFLYRASIPKMLTW